MHGGQTNADKLYFACGADHGRVSRGDYSTVVTDEYRLAWTDGTGPAQINHVHHPEELLAHNDP